MERNLCKNAEASSFTWRQSTDERWILKNFEDTIELGRDLGKKAYDLKLLLIQGPLGAGKTTLVKGLAASIGISEPITSPTFALAQHYPTGSPPLVHIDLYRLENFKSADELFLQEEEEANAIGAILVVEWPERLSLSLPEAWILELKYNPKGGRQAQLTGPNFQKMQ